MGLARILRPRICTLEDQHCIWQSRFSDGECRPLVPIAIESNPFTQRVATTKFLSLHTLCNEDSDGVNPGQDCCKVYGQSCGLTRYQELWCIPKDPVQKKRQELKKVLDKPEQTSDTCTHGGRTCQWYGSWPSCGGNEYQEGMWNTYNDKRRQLVITTELATKEEVCSYNSSWFDPNSGDCCDRYGWGCLSGYKRLWCYE
ncbi:hypothetical protein CP533_1671 [Ophiocordyceps camponoti-saundersi (nom. inval.)]|nr:hypothetical protein CP533_1671 [Ophiocordyceps camponoti-saundersi (nom. inval.)]